jgi:hypothetical protein
MPPTPLANVYVADIVGTQGGAHGKGYGTNAVFNVSTTGSPSITCVTGSPTPTHVPLPEHSPKPSPSPALGCSGALFAEPRSLALDAHGNLYVADSGPTGSEPTPLPPYSGPGIYEIPKGTGTPKALVPSSINDMGLVPTGVAVDNAVKPNIYISGVASGVAAGVYEYSPSTKTLTTIATESGTPGDVAVDPTCASQCTVYMADYGNGRVYQFTPPSPAPSTAPSSTPAPAATWTAKEYKTGLNDPYGIAVHQGKVYISQIAISAVEVIHFKSGTLTCVTGQTPVPVPSADGSACPAENVHKPHGIAVDANGNVYIADSNHGAIKIVFAGGSQAYCLTPTSYPTKCNGNHFTAGGAGFFHPNAVVPYSPLPTPAPSQAPKRIR